MQQNKATIDSNYFFVESELNIVEFDTKARLHCM